MSDRVTVTSRRGIVERLSGSIRSVLFGIALFVVSFPLLFWNEGRAVETAKSLSEGASVVTSISADSVLPDNDGRLVHVNGFAKTEDVLRDDTFGVSESAVKLLREVEMFQWVESSSSSSEKKLGGSEVTTTTYDYRKEWRSELVDSSRFERPSGHENPPSLPYESKSWTASSVTLGAFELSSTQVARLDRREPLELTAGEVTLPEGATLRDGAVFLGRDPDAPAVGDARVRFYVVRPGAVSVVARQVGATFEPFRAEAGGSVFLLEQSLASADAMFESAEAANTALTWGLRLLGFTLMFLGLATVFKPLAVAGDVVPLFGRLLGAGVALVSGLVAFFLTFVTVAVAWFAHRPLLSVALLALGAAALWLLVRASRHRAASEPPPPPPPPLPSSPGEAE